MHYTLEDISAVEARVQAIMPAEIPAALQSACKCVPIDPAWPIQGPLDALRLFTAWDWLEGRTAVKPEDHIKHITHSHAHEWEDVGRFGIENVYRKSLTTKYVSTAWHLAGRYEYDVALIAALTERGWPALQLIDFGAAPWIQSIFYARKGLRVTAINQSTDSDAHRFGQFLAVRSGVADRIVGAGSDDSGWREPASCDIVYAIDVLEHVPPTPEGTPGWIAYAEALHEALRPGGLWFVNAPLDYDPGTPHPVATHPVHYTSPISTETWAATKGLRPIASCLYIKE